MIFHADLAAKVMRGEKTVTRRPCQPGQECRYKVGRTYAVQEGRGKSSIGRIRITSVTYTTLERTTPGEARLEGFASLDEFRQRWAKMYGMLGGGTAYLGLWRIEFELAA